MATIIDTTYHLSDFKSILYNGFDFKLPDDTLQLINALSCEVGSPNYIKTPIFKKKNFDKRKKKINDEEWENMKTIKKVESKVGIDAQKDLMRSYLNKLSDKNYNDLKIKIIEVIDNLFLSSLTSEENVLELSNYIFEIASNNRFYSKLYADLFTELSHKYDMIKNVFNNHFDKFIEIFNTIEYADPNNDYDLFCKINKNNEKRKALSTFFVNLTINGLIEKNKIINIISIMLNQVISYLPLEEKKNVIDELTENIAIFINLELDLNLYLNKDDILNNTYLLNNNLNIYDTLYYLAKSKNKQHNGLSSKSIFKYMDILHL